MTKELDIERLKQEHNLKYLHETFASPKALDMMPVSYFSATPERCHGIFCAMIPNSELGKCLSDYTWDLQRGNRHSSILTIYEDESRDVYQRYGSSSDIVGIEPLIICRYFEDEKMLNYQEINQEFIWFHDLYYDKENNQYIKILEPGKEEVIAVVEDGEIKIRVMEIRQFLSIKNMHLAIQFEYDECFDMGFGELDHSRIEKKVNKDKKCYELYVHDDGYNHLSRLRGKFLISPFTHSSGNNSHKYAEFIIGIDESNGESIEHTCNPDLLKNDSGGNPEAEHRNTPVHFRREVLEKYYQQPSIYSVGPGYLKGDNRFNIPIDNHGIDKISVLLIDLGRLPYEEQCHWRQYNYVSNGSVSPAFHAHIVGDWSEHEIHPERYDLLFKKNYEDLQNNCSIFSPLSDSNKRNHFETIRILNEEESKDLNNLAISLNIILIERIDKRAMKKIVSRKKREHPVEYLGRFFKYVGIEDYDGHVKFLWRINEHRHCAVHADNGDMPIKSYIGTSKEYFKKSNEFILFLKKAAEDGKLDSLKKD